LAAFAGISLLYFTFFVALGICISALTRRSSVAFLIALVAWVTLVLIVPRLGVMAAGQLQPIPSVAEIDAQRDAFAKDRWDQHMRDMESRWRSRESGMAGLTKDQREAYRDENLGQWMEEDDARRKQVQKDIDAYSVRLDEGLRNSKEAQELLAFTLTRISPVASYQLAATTLAGTGIPMKARYEDAMREFRTRFTQYVERKQEETGQSGGFRIEFNTNTGLKFSSPREGGTLDFTDLPRFTVPNLTPGETLAPTIMDAGLLALSSVLAFVFAFLAFFRYDVR
jgi:ABC-type transport system involved in multi-copper enzyme maturation permease subunit